MPELTMGFEKAHELTSHFCIASNLELHMGRVARLLPAMAQALLR